MRVCGNVCCVADVVKYVRVRGVMDVMFSVCIVTCGAVGARVWYQCFVMQMFVSCMHPVAVLSAAFCMTCILLILVESAFIICSGLY